MPERNAIMPFDRHGWSYSLFAAFFAATINTALALLGRGIDTMTRDDWGQISRIAALALVAARLAGWLAERTGGRDHGLRAAGYTAIIFSLGVGLFLPFFVGRQPPGLIEHLAALWRGPLVESIGGVLGIAWFAAWIVAPSCFAGTGLFLGAIALVTRMRAIPGRQMPTPRALRKGPGGRNPV